MIVDVVFWSDLPDTCNRCGRAAARYIKPYWSPTHQICPTCCIELARLCDQMGWPEK